MNKIIAIIALVIFISAFLMPINVFAATDTLPPTLRAEIANDILTIETHDTGTSVEAVFINEKRFNYRIDSIIEVDAGEYAGEDERISIYSIDFAGNKSEVTILDNPYYVVPIEVPAETPEPIVSQPTTQTNPFTPSGQASVIDEANESDGKDFYTFSTPAGNVFYLIIDHQRDSENVYFLNSITEDDLADVAKKSDNKSSTDAVPTVETKPIEKTAEPIQSSEPEKPKERSTIGTIIFIVIALAAVGGVGYYYKVLKPKQQAASLPSDDDEDYGEEMEFENEIEEDEDE